MARTKTAPPSAGIAIERAARLGRGFPSRWTTHFSRYICLADRLWPEQITAFYVVGSTALGALQSGHNVGRLVIRSEGAADRGTLAGCPLRREE